MPEQLDSSYVLAGLVIATAVLGILHALASTIRNATRVHDLRIEVAQLKLKYQREMAKLRGEEAGGEELGEVEIIEDEPQPEDVEGVLDEAADAALPLEADELEPPAQPDDAPERQAA